MLSGEKTPSGWAAVSIEIRRGQGQRIVSTAVTALIFIPLVGWRYSTLWLLVFLTIQGVEAWLRKPLIVGARMSRWRNIAYGSCIVLSTSTFSHLALKLWSSDPQIGGMCAATVLCAAVVHCMVSATRSLTMLVLMVTPFTACLVAIPVLSHMRDDLSLAVVLGLEAGVVSYIYANLAIWDRLNNAYKAEMASALALEEKRVQAERMMADHGAFLAAVAHDLRTPLSAILVGSATELTRGDAASRSNANLVQDAGLMMKGLLDDLLDHAKLNAGRMTVEPADFDLRQLLLQTARLWSGAVRKKGLRLRLEGAAALPRMAHGDGMRLRQVLNNLISNALKFTKAGSITLRIKAWRDDADNHALLIEVADTGPGMTRDQLARLFTPFDQTASGVSAQHGGSGLGLAISRDLIVMMGGRLTARSTPGQGACFTLALTLPPAQGEASAPRGDDDAQVAAHGPAPSAIPPVSHQDPPADVVAEEQSRPLRLLVVDDHDINRRAVQLILTPLGCEITTAADGVTALARCAETAFDIVFMDVRMPDMDGRETTRRLRSTEGPNIRTPVVAVTADTAPEDIAECQSAGMAYFVAKPLTAPMLIATLQTVLDDMADQAGRAVA